MRFDVKLAKTNSAKKFYRSDEIASDANSFITAGSTVHKLFSYSQYLHMAR